MRPETTARPASTIILLRPAGRQAFEVLLTRRPEEMGFLGGMYVFPGGNVRAEDCSTAMIDRCRGLDAAGARQILGAHLKPRSALGHWIAAARELYEEAGVLLAAAADGGPPAVETLGRLAARRPALLAGKVQFHQLLREEELFCDLGRMVYFSHWETPRRFPLRFDTRFYVAPLPEGQAVEPDPAEVTESLWVAPDRALELFNRGRLPMIFPTFASLRTLADFESVESVLQEFGRSKPRAAV
ncbi:MAG TPA: hypothetical protein VNN77_05800 [candidate division Zixibacteria bacterium]|nr:hypothetical protein [candidate division Zixibacteria bacterium]